MEPPPPVSTISGGGPPKQHVYFGSLAENDGKAADYGSVTARAAASGNVQLRAGTRETAEDSEEMAATRAKAATLEADLAKQKAQKDLATAVPTNDLAVKRKLRELDEPISLFGEGPYERRERLKGAVATKGTSAAEKARERKAKEEGAELFFTEGEPELKAVRMSFARSSMQRAAGRLARERKLRENEDVYSYEDRLKRAQNNIQKNLFSEVSQVGDHRPLSHCAFSPDPATSYLATASWSGCVKLWKVPLCESATTLRAHDDRCTGVAWHPQACQSEPGTVQLASASANCKISLWSLDSTTPLRSIEEHEDRVNRLAFHPLGRHMISTSHDLTWRMWDLETGQSVLTQEGHSSPVYGVAIHPDGSLISTTDLSGLVRIWDLRTGRTLLPLEGHVKQTLCVDFHPGGYHLASGSDDNSVRVWDLRKRKCMQVLCAHSKLISSVKFEPEHGRFLLTSSFDQVSRIWSTLDYACTKSLAGHGARVMHADVAASTKYMATVAFDRTFKLWQYTRDDYTKEDEKGEDVKDAAMDVDIKKE